MSFFSDNYTLLFLCTIVSGFLYALQQVLLVSFARKIDPLTVSVYRNLSFLFTMSPILFLGWKTSSLPLFSPFSYWYFLLPACFTGALFFWSFLQVQRSIPVGFAAAFNQLNPIVLLFLSFVFLHQKISLISFLFICIIVLGTIFLSLQKVQLSHLETPNKKTFFLILLCILCGSSTFFFMSIVANATNPFLTGYFWEGGIGFFFLLFALLRLWFFSKRRKKYSLILSPKKIFAITFAASPTVLASALLPFAMTLGSIGVAHAINGASSLLFSLILAFFVFHEKLQYKSIFFIVIILIGAVGLRLSL